jgi:hypothetical protein
MLILQAIEPAIVNYYHNMLIVQTTAKQKMQHSEKNGCQHVGVIMLSAVLGGQSKPNGMAPQHSG